MRTLSLVLAVLLGVAGTAPGAVGAAQQRGAASRPEGPVRTIGRAISSFNARFDKWGSHPLCATGFVREFSGAESLHDVVHAIRNEPAAAGRLYRPGYLFHDPAPLAAKHGLPPDVNGLFWATTRQLAGHLGGKDMRPIAHLMDTIDLTLRSTPIAEQHLISTVLTPTRAGQPVQALISLAVRPEGGSWFTIELGRPNVKAFTNTYPPGWSWRTLRLGDAQ